jgi:Mor family transcriptional regulator
MKAINEQPNDPYMPSNWEEELLGYITKDQLVALEGELGGQYVWFKKEPSKQVVRLIGQEAAQALSDVYGASWIYVPQVLLKFNRNNDIARQINAGLSITELAAKYRIKTPAIIRILKYKYGYKP